MGRAQQTERDVPVAIGERRFIFMLAFRPWREKSPQPGFCRAGATSTGNSLLWSRLETEPPPGNAAAARILAKSGFTSP
jgi:hypothetical protein